jgi:hypothetical protein
MRKSTRFIGGLAMAGIVAAAGSAFTATSTIDNSNQHVGAVGQTISGVRVTNVEYEVDPAVKDKTVKVKFHVDQVLGAGDLVTATISDGAATPVTDSDDCEQTPAVAPATGTNLDCTFPTGVVNVTKLDIVAS